MQKTAALIREEKKKVQQEERKKMDDMKNSGNTSMQKYILQLYKRRLEVLDRMHDRKK